jgi:hypothetical protein
MLALPADGLRSLAREALSQLADDQRPDGQFEMPLETAGRWTFHLHVRGD